MVVRSTGSIFGVLLLIEDLEILVYDFLVGRLRCGLLGFVVLRGWVVLESRGAGNYGGRKLSILCSLWRRFG